MPLPSHRTSRASSSKTSPHPDPTVSSDNAYELQPISPHPEPDTGSGYEEEEDDDDESFIAAEFDALSVQSYELYTPDEESRVLRKLDRNLVAFLALLYALSFLDRSNIGNAHLAGLGADLHLSSRQYEWLLWAFYITYIAFEWMTLLYRVVPPHVYIALCVAAWGVVASMQATVTSFPFLLVLRALLGVAEAAFGPGVPFYLSFFFRREELALRTGLFISASPLSAAFAGALAWAITKVGEGGAVSPWRLLFLVEGFPSVVVAVWAWSFVPDGPGTAKWLTPRERRVAVLRLRQEREEDDEDEEVYKLDKDGYAVHGKRGIDLGEVVRTLRDPKCYLTALMFFSCNVAFASTPVFLPTLIHEMNHPPLTAQLLTLPPYLTALLAILFTAYLSDTHRTRSPFIIFHAALAALGYATIALAGLLRYDAPTLRYLALFPATAGFFTAVTLIISWTVNNQETATGRGVGVAIVNVVGQVGGLLGTGVFPEEEGPWYVRGTGVCAVFMGTVGVLAAGLRWWLERENRRRGKEGGGVYEGIGGRKRFEYML